MKVIPTVVENKTLKNILICQLRNLKGGAFSLKKRAEFQKLKRESHWNFRVSGVFSNLESQERGGVCLETAEKNLT